MIRHFFSPSERPVFRIRGYLHWLSNLSGSQIMADSNNFKIHDHGFCGRWRVDTFCHFFISGHFCMTDKIAMTDSTSIFSVIEKKLGQWPKGHRKKAIELSAVTRESFFSIDCLRDAAVALRSCFIHVLSSKAGSALCLPHAEGRQLWRLYHLDVNLVRVITKLETCGALRHVTSSIVFCLFVTPSIVFCFIVTPSIVFCFIAGVDSRCSTNQASRSARKASPTSRVRCCAVRP